MNLNTDLTSAAVSTAQSRRAAMTRQARIWVSQSFYGTLLKQMHESPFRSELFSGGRGGQAFSSLLDQHLTQRMADGKPTRSLADSIVRRVERSHSLAGLNPSDSFNTSTRSERVAPGTRD